MNTKTATLTSLENTLYTLSESYVAGSLQINRSGHRIDELDPSAGLFLIEPPINQDEEFTITYKTGDGANTNVTKTTFVENLSNSTLTKIIKILGEIIYAQNRLSKELGKRVTYTEIHDTLGDLQSRVKLLEEKASLYERLK